MATSDTCVSIVPYFKVHQGQLENFRAGCEKFVVQTQSEQDCLYYGFCFNGDEVHCREGYANAEAALGHLQNVDALLKEALTIADLTRLEIHGPEQELAKMRGPLAALNPAYFVLEYGFRK